MYEEDITLTFGRHKGTRLGQVPNDYLQWLVSENVRNYQPGSPLSAVANSAETILKKRAQQEAEYTNSATEDSFTYRHDTATADLLRHMAEMREKKRRETQGVGFDFAYGYGGGTQSSAAKSNVDPPAKQYKCTYCSDIMFKQCTECVRGLKLAMSSDKARTVQIAKQLDDARTDARQQRLIADNLRIAMRSQSANGSPSASDAKRGSEVKKKYVLAVISAGRSAMQRKHHPDLSKASNASEESKLHNSAADWLEKCSENLS